VPRVIIWLTSEKLTERFAANVAVVAVANLEPKRTLLKPREELAQLTLGQ